MGLLNRVIPKSLANGNCRSSEYGRPWALLGRAQSETPGLAQEKTETTATSPESDALKAIDSDDTSKDRVHKHAGNLQGSTSPQKSIKRIKSRTRNSIYIDPDLSSTSPKLSTRGTRRLTGFSTLFRSRKSQRQDINLGFSSALRKHRVSENGEHLENTAPKISLEDVPPLLQDEELLDKVTDLRKVSDKTDYSLNSNNTSTTVCRDPSKRSSAPITLVDSSLSHQNPFDDVWRMSYSETSSSNPFSDPSKTMSHSTTQLSSTYSDPTNQKHIIDTSTSSTQTSSFCQSLSGANFWPTPLDQRMAAVSFNEIASEMYLEPLALCGNDDHRKLPSDGQIASGGGSMGQAILTESEPEFVGEDKLFRRRDRLLGRIRTMRSTFHIKAQPPVPQEPILRRRKTFSGLSSRPGLMTSLRGKSLESLARLGGYSFLTLPGDFAPAALSLPVCFVAIINYLRCFAPTVRNLFLDAGDIDTAARTYDHFATQVLSAEREQEKIQITMRSGKMPEFLVGEPDADSSGKLSAQVLGVAWAFKVLLSGVPGGILGSVKLYHILASICYGRMSDPSGPSKRVSSGLEGLSPENYVKVRAISLAIVALTSSMQLSLICAVFGFCSLLLHETERISELERLKTRAIDLPAFICSGNVSVERLGEVLGPLLTDKDRDGNPDTFQAIEHEIKSQRVVSLLIENWRSVSRQLRVWEHGGVEA